MMDDAHVDAVLVERYVSGNLPAGESLRVADHLYGCARCRASAQQTVEVSQRLVGLRSELEPPAHLDFDEMVRWNSMDRGDPSFKRISAHLAACAACRDEARDLAAAEKEWNQRRTRPWRWVAAAAAAVVVLVSAWLMWPRNQAAPPSPPSGREIVRQPRAESSPPVVAVVDRSGRIELERDGTVRGVPGGDTWRSLAAGALSSATISIAPLPDALNEGSSSLRGGEPDDDLTVRAPIGVAVAPARPEFAWSAGDGARVQVKIFNDRGERVAESEIMTSRRWQPPSPLARGKLYTWQVTVYHRDGSQSIAPRPPAPAARFFVIGEEAARDIDEARRTESHLLQAIAYARAGMREEAHEHLNALARLNPRSSIIQSLMASTERPSR